MFFRQDLIKISSYECQYNEVKDAINGTKYEETSVTDDLVINVQSYFKLFECGKKKQEQY